MKAIKFPKRPLGFTLIELLVVIAVIGVLAGLLFPAIGGAMIQARRTTAKSDAVNLANAIQAYRTEYGFYPSFTSGGTAAQAGDAGKFLMETLMAIDLSSNKRGIRFIEVPNAKIRTADSRDSKGGLDSGNNWKDPWGNKYVVHIDHDYDNKLDSVPGPDIDETLYLGVAVYSQGQPNNSGANDRKNRVSSWR